ncbi:MAG: twin-arginine translocase TatA/TatE family subunit [Microbacteriaceae bacterium]
MPSGLGGWSFVVLAVVVILLFGAPKLPVLSKSIADSLKIFRKEMKDDTKPEDGNAADEGNTTPKP